MRLRCTLKMKTSEKYYLWGAIILVISTFFNFLFFAMIFIVGVSCISYGMGIERGYQKGVRVSYDYYEPLVTDLRTKNKILRKRRRCQKK